MQAPKERDTHSAAMLGGQMIILGGDRGGEYLADVWSYSLADNAWTQLQVRSCWPALCLLVALTNRGEKRACLGVIANIC